MDLIVYIQDKLRISDQTEQVLKVGLSSSCPRFQWGATPSRVASVQAAPGDSPHQRQNRSWR